MGIGGSFGEAFAKATLAAGEILPKGGLAFISVKKSDRPYVAEVAKQLTSLGFEIVATGGTARTLRESGVISGVVNKVAEGRPDVTDLIKNEAPTLIVNTTEGRQAIIDSAVIRRLALRHKVCYTTTLAGGEAFCIAMRHGNSTRVRSLQEIHRGSAA